MWLKGVFAVDFYTVGSEWNRRPWCGGVERHAGDWCAGRMENGCSSVREGEGVNHASDPNLK